MYIYHLFQPGFVGETLYPLNQLRIAHPEIFDSHAKKYENRADLLELRRRELPFLGCTMDDLVCFVSVDFSLLLKSYAEIQKAEERIERSYFRVDTDQLEQENLLIAFHEDTVEDAEGRLVSTVDGYLPFADGCRLLPEQPPSEQIERYKQDHQEGIKGPLAAYVPHVYYKGTIEGSAITKETFVWDPPPTS